MKHLTVRGARLLGLPDLIGSSKSSKQKPENVEKPKKWATGGSPEVNDTPDPQKFPPPEQVDTKPEQEQNQEQEPEQQPEFLMDDSGFPSHPPPTQTGDPKYFDAEGFPLHPLPTNNKTSLDDKDHDMATDTNTAKTVESYASMIDHSTPHTQITTARGVAENARNSAQQFAVKADSLRQQAGSLQGKEGMQDAVARLLSEAAKAQQTSEQRLGMAAAYEEWASELAAQAAVGAAAS